MRRIIFPIARLSALLVPVIYIGLALAAYFQFPGQYSPLTNWLSDLGNNDLNPSGAVYYNLGIILTGLLLILFFFGASIWKMENNKTRNIMVRLTQGFGILGSMAMVMTAVYPINFLTQHSFWSISLYILLGTAFGFSVAALRYSKDFPRWVLALGAATAAVDMLSGVLHEATVMEWVTVAMFLIYISVINAKSRLDNSR